MTKRSVTFYSRGYEWGRLNHEKPSKDDRKVTKSTFSVSIMRKKAAYWPLLEPAGSRLEPAPPSTLGNLSHFWPQPAKRCPKGVPEQHGIGSSRTRFLHQTKQRAFWPEPSRTLKSRQESVLSAHFRPLDPVQAAPLIGLSRLVQKV